MRWDFVISIENVEKQPLLGHHYYGSFDNSWKFREFFTHFFTLFLNHHLTTNQKKWSTFRIKKTLFLHIFSRKPTTILIIQFHVIFITTFIKILSQPRENYQNLEKIKKITPRQLRIYDRFDKTTSKNHF